MTIREKVGNSPIGFMEHQALKNGDILQRTFYGSFLTKPVPEPIIICPCCKEQDNEHIELEITNSDAIVISTKRYIYICPNCGIVYAPKYSNKEEIDKIELENEKRYQEFLDQEYKKMIIDKCKTPAYREKKKYKQ